jgi:hypothetical protein
MELPALGLSMDAMKTLSNGWQFIISREDGSPVRASLADLDKRLDLGLRGASLEINALLEAVVEKTGARAEAYFNGRRLAACDTPHATR